MRPMTTVEQNNERKKNIVIIVWLVALKIVSFGVLLFCVCSPKKIVYKIKSECEKRAHQNECGRTHTFMFISIYMYTCTYRISYTYFALASVHNVQMVDCFWNLWVCACEVLFSFILFSVFFTSSFCKTNRNELNENGNKSNRKNLYQNGLTLIYFEHAIL